MGASVSKVVILSGPIGAGKSTLTRALERRVSLQKLSTRDLLRSKFPDATDRASLQALGAKIDHETNEAWVADAVASARGDRLPDLTIVDCVRTRKQVEHFRAHFGSDLVHVHLTADEDIRRSRYEERSGDRAESTSFRDSSNDPIERRVNELSTMADLVVNTASSQIEVIATLALGLIAPEAAKTQKLVDVIVGSQYGSEGKGNFCAHIAKQYDLLMRVGGPNAGHKVANPAYTYVQLPSGTQSNPDATIVVGAGATISLEVLLKEISELKLTPRRLVIDHQAMIIDAADIVSESKTFSRFASTQKGVGAATARKILGRDGEAWLGAKTRLARDTPELKPFVGDTKERLEYAYSLGQRILLEGTQGTGLSLHHGFYPNVTSRETTASGCLADAGIAPLRVSRIFMVTRTYPIRVGGSSGPMGQELRFEDVAIRSGLSEAEIRKTEIGSVSGRTRRIAEFDWEQFRRSVSLNRPTDICLSFADYIAASNRSVTRYDSLSDATKLFVEQLERVSGANVSLISAGFGTGLIER